MDAINRVLTIHSRSESFRNAVAFFVEASADEVARLLMRISKAQPDQKPKIARFLTHDRMLALGLAVSIRRWETSGFLDCLSTGLPSAKVIFRRAFSVTPDPDLCAYTSQQWFQALGVLHDSLVWHIDETDTYVELAMSGTTEEGLLDLISEFLISSTELSPKHFSEDR